MVKNPHAVRETWVGKIIWRRAWQSTPVSLPGESHGQRSLVGYSSWGCKVVQDWQTKHSTELLSMSQTLLINLYAPWKQSYDQPRQHIKKQRHYCDNKGPSSRGYGFSSGHVWMWELDYRAESRRIDAFELWCWRRLESPLDCKEIQPVHPNGDQPCVFIGRTDFEAETPILWSPDAMSWLIWKDPDAGKDWGQEEKGTTEVEMVGWHHRPNGHGFGWTPGVSNGQGGLVCCSSWGRKDSDTTKWLNWTELT